MLLPPPLHSYFDDLICAGADDMVEEEEEEDEEGAHMDGAAGEGMIERARNVDEDMDVEQHVNGS